VTLRSGRVSVNGVTSQYLEGGDTRSTEAVVFVHGNPGSCRDWEPLASAVAAFSRVIALDMPGFGQADRPVDFEYTVEGYARHLGGALDRLGVTRAHLVLHDFGGPWGLAWAARNPAAFASAVLINTGVLLDYQWHWAARLWRIPLLGEAVLSMASFAASHGMWRRVNGTSPRPLPEAFQARLMTAFDAGTRRAVLRLYRSMGDLSRNARLLQRALRPLDRPALVIWGQHDAFIPVTHATQQLETFPRAHVHILQESGHWPFADDPDQVATLVLPFLRDEIAPRLQQTDS
jgi:pimeloyl-ACP methyl ester carboxylesterase